MCPGAAAFFCEDNSVLFYLLCVAILNLGLGYALAIALGHHRSASASFGMDAVIDLPPPTFQPAASQPAAPSPPPAAPEKQGEPVVAPALLADDELSDELPEVSEAAAAESVDMAAPLVEEITPTGGKSIVADSVDDFLAGLQQFR